MIDPIHFKQFVRYGVIGVLNNSLLYLLYLLITGYGIEPKLAMTILYCLGLCTSFLGNRKWTFEHRDATKRAIFRYVIAQLFGYLLNVALLYLFVDRIGYPHQWIQLIAIIVVAVYLFLALKFFVFRTPKYQFK